MVSPDASTEGSGSANTMDEKEKRFYGRSIPFRQTHSSSPSQSESLSESSEHISSAPQKKTPPARTPTTPSKPPSSSVKRPRNEDDEPTNKKTKKSKPTKEESKKTNEDKKKIKKPEPQPSPQKSAKKPFVWNPKEEILFLKALAAYCQDGKEFPKNILTPVYDYVRNHSTMDGEYSNSQLGEKMRRLRNKFTVMDDRIKCGGFSFKTSHDETLYKLCKKIWGREQDGEESEDEESEEQTVEAEMGNGTKGDQTVKKVGQDEEEAEDEDEEEENKKTGDDVEMTQKENDEVEEEDEEVETNAKQNMALRKHVAAKEALATPNVVSNATISNVQDNNHAKLIDQFLKENSVIMNGFKDQLSRENEKLKSEIEKMVREGLQSSVNGKASNSIGFSSEDVVKRIYSAKELPTLDVSEARILEQKWQRQHLVELEVCSGHLALLQEECQKRIEKLRSFVDEDRH